jgi:hypothetical protein
LASVWPTLLSMNESISRQIAETVAQFSTIQLDQMDQVKLLDRVDTKYWISIEKITELLEKIKSDYYVVEVAGQSLSTYRTLYFDTPELVLYHAHQKGKLQRVKVRQRHYTSTNTVFTEIKLKNNKGRTIKTRIPQEALDPELQAVQTQFFLQNHLPFDASTLGPTLWVYYQRLTLVSKTFTERTTFDFALRFEDTQQQSSYPNLVIVEIKQHTLAASPLAQWIRQLGQRPGGMSKYCLGMVSLHDQIKKNRFKMFLNQLRKISLQTTNILP